MQINAGLNLLTTAEAADYLRIKERKLYELVAADAIPCTKVSGKWLFPRADLDRWLLAGMARPLGVAPADPPPIIGGNGRSPKAGQASPCFRRAATRAIGDS